MNKFAAAIIAASALSALPLLAAQSAQAEVCGTVGGPMVNVNGCLPPGTLQEGAAAVGSIAVADAVDEWHQRLAGRPPCYTPQGVPYYTPGDAPCA